MSALFVAVATRIFQAKQFALNVRSDFWDKRYGITRLYFGSFAIVSLLSLIVWAVFFETNAVLINNVWFQISGVLLFCCFMLCICVMTWLKRQFNAKQLRITAKK